ncbi:hypothetical protein RI129_006519 [Pyrocoelia pectoralis]|uniref:Major facilitator superfamily (MFS) profile domain-containing protein n=1 Tax=Pyrocoelia pectoralis TaxID=417401 RepID=A0AAN7VFF6_9COLE
MSKGGVIIPKEYKMKESSTVSTRPSDSTCFSKLHLNSLWSVWYGVFGTLLQLYIATKCIKKLNGYELLPWPNSSIPYAELNVSLTLLGLAVFFLIFFLLSSLLKIGNLANDSFKLGLQLSNCSQDPPSELLGTMGAWNWWTHGGPTAPFIHILIAFLLLLPRLLMETKLIASGLLPQEYVWHTDLDFIIQHRESMLMNFVTISPIGTSSVLPVIQSSEDTNKLKDLFFNNIFTHLRSWFGSDDHVMNDTGPSISLEYINLAISLAVYSIRYSAVFWGTNKCLGLIFSIQMLVNSVQILTTYVGISILYKIPVMKPHPPIQLNHLAILSLFISSSLVILSSSVVLYLYGHTRFNGFLNKQQEKRVIIIREGSGQSKWSWVAYFGAVVVVILITPCIGLLINDFVIVNRVCQNKTVLISAIACVSHVFIWIIVWGFLLIKGSWTFKLRVTVGKAVVKQPASVKLVTDVDLMTRHSQDPSVLPLLVVGNGETYSVADISPKREILNIIAKAKMQRKNGDKTNGEQVYFMKPTLVSPKASPDEEDLTYFNRGNKKVTFKEPIARDKIDFDDGDYAALKELPLPLPPPPPSDEDDTISEAEINTVHTTHCLHRDSALLPDELTARSDSMSTGSPSPPDQPESNTSESSSGVHSNESSENQPNITPTILRQHARRASSIANLSQCNTKEEVQWRSGSLQRNVQPPTSSFVLSTSPPSTHTQQLEHGTCAILYETPSESTVVIRRKAARPKTNEIAPGVTINEEPFGRATNMRMTSFTEHSDLKGMQMTSSTLPHYPTQPIPTPNSFPHCSTMPLPQQHKPNASSSTNLISINAISDGMQIGWPSPIIPRLLSPSSPINVEEKDVIWLEISYMLGELVALIPLCYLSHKIGRKKTILVASAAGFLGWILMIFASTVTGLIIARFVGGLGGVINYVITPVYIAEISHKNVRGRLGSIIFVMNPVGTLLVYSIGPYIPITNTNIAGAIIVLIPLLIFAIMPESPYDLLIKKRDEEARSCLKILRAMDNVDEELNDILAVVRRVDVRFSLLNDIKRNRKAFLITMVLSTVYTFSGFSVLVMNMEAILSSITSTIPPATIAILFSVFAVVSCLVDALFMDLLGRRTILMASCFSASIFLILIAVYLTVKGFGSNITEFAWIPIVIILVYAIVITGGIGLIPVLLSSEIFQSNLTAIGCAFGSALYNITSILAIVLYEYLSTSVGIDIPFYIFGVYMLFCGIFCILMVPETKKKTLGEIQNMFKRETCEESGRLHNPEHPMVYGSVNSVVASSAADVSLQPTK